jgi:aquaporin Z
VGTALLVAIGTGAIVLSARVGGVPQWELALAWFFAVLVPIVLFARISGAHLNPAVTLGLAASGRIGWAEVPEYVLGQLVGAFLGSAFVAVTFGSEAHLGSTLPSTSVPTVFGAEAALTAALAAAVFVLADRGEGRFRWRLALPPLVVGVSTYVIGPLTGSSLNPARTIAPAVLSGSFADLWVYLVSVPLGALMVGLAWRPKSINRRERGPLGHRKRELSPVRGPIRPGGAAGERGVQEGGGAATGFEMGSGFRPESPAPRLRQFEEDLGLISEATVHWGEQASWGRGCRP